jgi:hypothetical protein
MAWQGILGSHLLERGEPMIRGEVRDDHLASYLGLTDGRNIALDVRLLDSGD